MGQYALNAPRGRERVVDQDLGFGERQQGKKKKKLGFLVFLSSFFKVLKSFQKVKCVFLSHVCN